MLLIRIHKSYREVVALCDKELLGKRFEQPLEKSDKIMQLNVKESFYSGEEVDEKQAIKILQDRAKEDATFNIVGENACNTAIKAGIINQNSISKIAGIKYSLVLL